MPAFSQEPSYIRLGEEELANVDIYSIYQDRMGQIWLGTQQNLVKYDGYSFSFITDDGGGTRSLFGLTENKAGDIFCFSLGGEIYRVRNDSLLLYFTVPDSLHNIEQTIFFDDADNLVVCGRHTFRITPSRQIQLLYRPDGKPVSAFNGLRDARGRFVLGHSSGNAVSFIEQDQVRQQIVTPGPTQAIMPIASAHGLFLQAANEFQLFTEVSGNFAPVKLNNQHIKPGTQAGRLYIPADSTYWFSTRSGGIYAFHPNGSALYQGQRIFRSYFISGFLEDREGNYWFTTLGKGLLFIPNPFLITYQNDEILKNENITCMAAGDNGQVYLGSEAGNIIVQEADGKCRFLVKDMGIKVSLLVYFPQRSILAFQDKDELVFYHTGTGKVVQRIQNIFTVKDIAPAGHNGWIIGTSSGIRVWPGGTADMPFRRRVTRFYYHSPDSTAWIAAPSGFFRLAPNGQTWKLPSYGAVPVDVDGELGKIWVATGNAGIACLENGSITRMLTPANGLLGRQVRRILAKNGYLFIAHERGLQVYDIAREVFVHVDRTDGLLSNYIIDFDYHKGMLSVVTQKGLQRFPLDRVKDNPVAPLIRITSVKVNDMAFPFPFTSLRGRTSDAVEVFFSASAYRHQGALTYLYRLRGKQEDWDTAGFGNNHVRYASLQPGNYQLEVKAVNENNVSSEAVTLAFTIMPPLWQRWWFYLAISVLVLLVLLVIYKFQLRRIQRKNLQKNELISSRLTALKSQMNPHFIFNSLNSVQDLILRQETEKSYDYIVKFSSLVRQTLNYSDKEFIDFEDELKLLEVYLELEQLRFPDRFSYRIEKRNVEEIEVPPMLVQPFVENAIKHGLLHKSGDKKLSIVFEQTDILTCTITDNGIGRTKSKEIKDRQRKSHESFSVGAINRRFEIMQELYKTDLGVRYEDLYDSGMACGTRVVLRLPFKPRY